MCLLDEMKDEILFQGNQKNIFSMIFINTIKHFDKRYYMEAVL